MESSQYQECCAVPVPAFRLLGHQHSNPVATHKHEIVTQIIFAICHTHPSPSAHEHAAADEAAADGAAANEAAADEAAADEAAADEAAADEAAANEADE